MNQPYELEEKDLIETVAYSTQGVCFDGTYYYVTDNDKIYKYNTSGTKVAERDCTSDGTNHHLGDLCIKDGILYVASSAYPSTPLNGYIKEYNASDLTYRSTEYFLGSTNLAESVDFDANGDAWTVSDGNLLQKWDTGFTSPTTYVPNVVPTQNENDHGWNGLKWHDGYLYMNVHEDSVPNTLHRFAFDGTDLTIDAYYPRPKWCSQGFDIDGDTFILGKRGYGVVDDGIVLGELVPYDFRQNTVIIKEDFTERSTVVDSYGEQTHLKASIVAKKDDIICVTLQANFRVSANGVRAYVDPSGTNTTSVRALNEARSIRTQVQNTEGISLGQQKYYAVNENGKVTFAMWWKRTGGSGTVYADDRMMTLQIIGKDTD